MLIYYSKIKSFWWMCFKK